MQTPPPFQTCKNPKCTRPFPLRSNKLFCSLRCKNKYHNDQSRDPNRLQVQKNKRLKLNEDILGRIALRTDMENVSKEILAYEGYDFNYYTSSILNPTTKQMVHWIYEFGIEKNKERTTYTIHLAPKPS
jgi:hypothetical protein